jgi:chromosome segregation ATPase
LNQEKFVNSYIDLLNATLNEAINKNLVIQAQKKVLEDELKEVKRKDDLIASLRDSHAKEISDLKSQLNDARKQKEISSNEANDLRKSVQHVDTFKNELSKERVEKENLNKQLNENNIEMNNLRKEIEELKVKLESKNTTELKSSLTKKTKTPTLPNFIFEESVPLNTVKDAGKF